MCHQMFAKCAVCNTVTVGDLDATLHALTHEGEMDDAEVAVVEEDVGCRYCGEEYTEAQMILHLQECAHRIVFCGYCGEECAESQMNLHFQECARLAEYDGDASFDSDVTTDGEVGSGGAGRQTGRKTSDRV